MARINFYSSNILCSLNIYWPGRIVLQIKLVSDLWIMTRSSILNIKMINPKILIFDQTYVWYIVVDWTGLTFDWLIVQFWSRPSYLPSPRWKLPTPEKTVFSEFQSGGGLFFSLKKLISEQKISKGTKNKALHLFFWLFLIAEKKILALLCLHLKNVFFKNDIQYNEIKQTIQNTITSKDFLSSHLLKDRISNCVF